jgi:hypothetical protein
VTRLFRALVVAALVALGAGPAWGFVRDKTKDGVPIYWNASCATATVYLNGFSMMTRDEVAKSIAAAAHAWSPSEVDCSAGDGGVGPPSFEIVPTLAPPGAVPPPVGQDGQNIVVFKTDSWDDTVHILGALAVTSVLKKSDGRILDADMEINAVTEAWGNFDPGSPLFTSPDGDTTFDLQNAITHEFGHFIGLNHSCEGPADAVQLIDNDGNPAPDCDFAPNPVKMTTMYAVIAPKETSRRELSPDDIAGVCTIYPPDTAPHACTLDVPDDGCGCASAPRGERGRAELVAVAALAAIAFTRGRRGRARR